MKNAAAKYTCRFDLSCVRYLLRTFADKTRMYLPSSYILQIEKWRLVYFRPPKEVDATEVLAVKNRQKRYIDHSCSSRYTDKKKILRHQHTCEAETSFVNISTGKLRKTKDDEIRIKRQSYCILNFFCLSRPSARLSTKITFVSK